MSLDSKTILVVDDEPLILDSIEKIFAHLGCRTLLARSGEEALEISCELEEKIDLLVTDVILPNMKGHELAKHFSKRYPETKVLFMSGYMCPAISENDIVNREKAFIQKPFLPRELLKVSEKLLANKEELRE